MSKGGRLSKLIPKFFRSSPKDRGDGAASDKGPRCSVLFLDDTEQTIPYKSNWKGQMLLDTVCEMINLVEKDYFGIRFVDTIGQVHWLDGHRSLSSQLRGCPSPVKCYFCVKFYSADPCKLREELTRYLFFLQVKRDILQGRLPVTFDEAAELCAYAVQSELGDFDPKAYTVGYVSEFCFIPNQSEELEARIAAIHRRCSGATPLMAEHRFLEKVKWFEMYGVDLHPVQGDSGVDYFLGLTPTGVVVYKHKTKVASYFWPRVTKATYKNKTFIVKVKDRNNDEHTYAFELGTKQACKHLWKCCMEHHAFFRLSQTLDKESRPKKVLRSLSNASSRGRSERQSAGSDQRPSHQASVRRVPSRRQPRRISSDSRLNATPQYSEVRGDVGVITMMSQPQPVRAPRHRSLPELQGKESPRSVKTAPWESKFDYGLYTSGHDSPTSGRSDRRHARPISAGSDSESGFSHRRRYFPGRKGSDNDSDLSANRRRRREMDSDSESDVSLSNSGRNRKRQNFNNRNSDHIVYSTNNKENLQNGSIPSLHSAPAGEMRQRRRRRRSKSPGNTKRPPEELKQHIEFDLIETEGMSQDQLMDIPFTKVETKASLFRVKYSPKFRQKIWASRHKSHEPDRNSEPSRRPRSEGGGTLSRQDSNNTEPARRSAGYATDTWMSSNEQKALPPDSAPQREFPSPTRGRQQHPNPPSTGYESSSTHPNHHPISSSRRQPSNMYHSDTEFIKSSHPHTNPATSDKWTNLFPPGSEGGSHSSHHHPRSRSGYESSPATYNHPTHKIQADRPPLYPNRSQYESGTPTHSNSPRPPSPARSVPQSRSSVDRPSYPHQSSFRVNSHPSHPHPSPTSYPTEETKERDFAAYYASGLRPDRQYPAYDQHLQYKAQQDNSRQSDTSAAYPNPVYFNHSTPPPPSAGRDQYNTSRISRDSHSQNFNDSHTEQSDQQSSHHRGISANSRDFDSRGSSANSRYDGMTPNNVRSQGTSVKRPPQYRSPNTSHPDSPSQYHRQFSTSTPITPTQTEPRYGGSGNRSSYGPDSSRRGDHSDAGYASPAQTRSTGRPSGQRPASYGDSSRDYSTPQRGNTRSRPYGYTESSPRGRPDPPPDLSVRPSHTGSSYTGPSPSSSGYSGSHSQASASPHQYQANSQRPDDRQGYQQYPRGAQPPAAESVGQGRYPPSRQSQGYMRPPNMAAYRSDLVTEL